MVVGVLPHCLQVIVFAADAQALLGTSGTYKGEPLHPQKDIFKLHHSRVGEQEGWIFLWN